ncbi:DNA primase family protein [Emticicia sp. SJ17W-69]|uniref:DNA primase family protein n=1 Tax=Emticicia sp. SJ17W-69 TaxID=3421657 RepID=UPI003EB8A684
MENSDILNVILEDVKKINFREKAGKAFIDDENKKLFEKHYLICVVEEIQSVAKNRGYALCKHYGNIYLNNGAYWSLVEEDHFQTFLGKASEKMGVSMFDARFFRFQENLFKQFLSSCTLSNSNRKTNAVLINLQNGTFEITKGKRELRNFKEEDFLTYQLPFEYQPYATAPIFKSYLDRVLPDVTLQNILAEYIGYVFVKNLKLEKVLLLYGSGANGKSVFFDIINAILGEQNISNFSLQSLNDPAYRAKIATKLLNYGSEIKGCLESNIFKQIASGEKVEAKALYKDPFIMSDYAKLLFNCNELPKDVEHNEAYFRRFIIIPFEVTIPNEERDVDLPKKIIEKELSGVFNWIMEGLERILEQKKFSHSPIVDNYIEAYKKESDSIALFIDEEGYKAHHENFILLSNLFQSYRLYCSQSGHNNVNRNNFRARLQNLKFNIERKEQGNCVYLEKKTKSPQVKIKIIFKIIIYIIYRNYSLIQ